MATEENTEENKGKKCQSHGGLYPQRPPTLSLPHKIWQKFQTHSGSEKECVQGVTHPATIHPSFESSKSSPRSFRHCSAWTGYSGDWSRIGFISNETEDFLKLLVFVVVPLCLFLIFLISEEPAA